MEYLQPLMVVATRNTTVALHVLQFEGNLASKDDLALSNIT